MIISTNALQYFLVQKCPLMDNGVRLRDTIDHIILSYSFDFTVETTKRKTFYLKTYNITLQLSKTFKVLRKCLRYMRYVTLGYANCLKYILYLPPISSFFY